MTQSPLKVFNIEGGQLVAKSVGIPDVECHPHNFQDPTPVIIRELPEQLKEIHALAVTLGKDVDVVRVGVGDPFVGKACEQRVYVAPKGQRGLAEKTMRVAV